MPLYMLLWSCLESFRTLQCRVLNNLSLSG
jgi:hypothetical protein